jgi:hypothetical protein
LRVLSLIFFLLLWIPFAMIMLTGPLSLVISGPDAAIANGPESLLWGMGIWVVLTVGLGLAATFFFIASLVISGMSNIMIEAKGQDAEAEIVSVSDTGTRINDNPVVAFSLNVRPMGHPHFAGQARRTISIVELPQYQPGKVVRVKFVPGKEQVAIVGTANSFKAVS